MSSNNSVVLFYQRKSGAEDDFIVRIYREEGGYLVKIKESDVRDPAQAQHFFEELDHVLEYISILTYQVLNDTDVEKPFTHFQYCIPFFPSIVLPLENLHNSSVYDRFQQAVEFYFSD